MKIVAITQARTGSTRLPGKVMMDLMGKPMLTRHVERVMRARRIDEVVVATTTLSKDDVIHDLCKDNGWLCFRGSESDVLDRYYRAALERGADIVVRVTSDCPLIDPDLIDDVIAAPADADGAVEFAANRIQERSYPIGLDCEAMLFPVLARIWKDDTDMSSREHVTTYVYHNLGLFRVRDVSGDGDYRHMRWTVDVPEDLEFVRKIYEHFGHDHFSWTEVVDILKVHPEWMDINRHIRQKKI
ncbi:MAG: glycosyltransferase family protein [Pseudomonadota bacterium]